MSKAFKKDDDSAEDGLDEESEVVSALPSGEKNYITPQGAEKLQQELHELKFKIRPEVTATVAWAASNGDRSENADYIYGKKRLREIDRRLRFLTKRLEAAVVVDSSKQSGDVVHFGAAVTIRYEDERERTFRIVGIDETNVSEGYISWISPLAKVLLKGKLGDVVTFQTPKGEEEIEIIKVEYP